MDHMKWIGLLIASATLFNGVLAGIDVDRWVVGMPAWHAVGVVGWANYSRSADLGNGLFLYPILAIVGTLFSLAAAVSFMRQTQRERFTSVAIYVAAALALAGLLMTFKAAPFMLSLQHLRNEDVTALQQAFDGFEFWGGIRAILQTLAFGANLCSLATIFQIYQPRLG
jgi:hypothetical protein